MNFTFIGWKGPKGWLGNLPRKYNSPPLGPGVLIQSKGGSKKK